MKNYKITFWRKNSKISSDTVTANNENSAINDFKQIYRHAEKLIILGVFEI